MKPYVLGISGGVCLLLLLVFVAYCFRKRKRRNKKGAENSNPLSWLPSMKRPRREIEKIPYPPAPLPENFSELPDTPIINEIHREIINDETRDERYSLMYAM
ncbi:hypothetical protein ACMFMG_002662 [Clarireedia jacksonii]